jgi:hypothetical protein
MARAWGVVVLFAALGFGAALLLDVGGLQSKLFTEGLPERAPPTARLPEKPGAASSAPGPITPVWYIGANGFEGADLERQSARATLVVYFQKRSCDACRKFEREVLASAEVKSFLENVVKVRVDPGDGVREQRLARRFGVERLPALAVIPQRGPPHLVPLERGRALLSPHELIAFCR